MKFSRVFFVFGFLAVVGSVAFALIADHARSNTEEALAIGWFIAAAVTRIAEKGEDRQPLVKIDGTGSPTVTVHNLDGGKYQTGRGSWTRGDGV